MDRRLLLALPLLLLLAGVPMAMQQPYARHLLILTFLFATVAASWDLTLGYAGLFNFGHIAFFGIGVYVAGIWSVKLGLEPWLSLPLAMIAAGLAAAVLAAPVLRLRGIYVVLVTFAFSQLCLQVILSQTAWTGGAGGIVLVPALKIGAYNFGRDGKLGYYELAFAACALTVLALHLLVRTRLGKTARAVRDNPEYAAARGVDQGRTRLLMLILSALPTGLAGAIYCLYFRVAAPEVFSFSNSTFILSILLVGGVSTIWGPVAAAVVIVMANEYLERFPNLVTTKHMVLAATIILVLRFFPRGLSELSQLLTWSKFRLRRTLMVE